MEKRIKKSFACSKVEQFQIDEALVSSYTPKMGDVGIFKVLKPNGGYILNPSGTNCDIFEDDYIMLAFGNRYATSQLEGYVPESPVSNCQLLGRGGVAGSLKSLSGVNKKVPSELKLVGYATNYYGEVINTIQKEELSLFSPLTINSKVILSIGSTMDSGKTTTAAYLCGGLSKAGYKTAYIKLTGTAFPKDAKFVYDRGADFAIDFTQFGYPSTFLCEKEELLDLYQSLVNIAQDAVAPDYIVVEIADGILQRETNMLLNDRRFMSSVHQVIFSCGDSLSVLSGLQVLDKMNIHPFAVAGLFTASDLLVAETKAMIDTPVLTLSDLLKGVSIQHLKTSVQLKSKAIAA